MGGFLHLFIALFWMPIELVEKGYSASQVKNILEVSRDKMVIYVGLSTLEYLKRGGRIKSSAALAANLLNIKPVMKFGTGKLDVFQKCRGMKKSRKAMIDAMHTELETTFKEEYAAGKVYLMAASSSSTEEVTADWVAQIKRKLSRAWKLCAMIFHWDFPATSVRTASASDAPARRYK